MDPETSRMLLCSVQVKGVPEISVEEALWTRHGGTADRGVTVYHRRVASVLKPPPPSLPLVTTGPDERAARRDLLEQIARLESDLSALFCSAYPRGGFDWAVPSRGGPRVLSLPSSSGSATTSPSASTTSARTLSDRTWVEEQNRRLIEEMMLEPEKHKWVRVGNEDIGERGCKHWHVRPRCGHPRHDAELVAGPDFLRLPVSHLTSHGSS